MTGVILLDKDGTLVENVPMNVDPSRIRLMDGAAPALSRLANAGYRIAIVSNQAGVALGHFPERALIAVEARLRELMADCGVPFGGFFYCPHHPNGVVAQYRCVCPCRKPAPGLLVRAMHALSATPLNCWMIGDILDDVEAAHRAGCRGILFDSGGETEWLESPLRVPDFATRALEDAADYILSRARRVA
jgi:histidinol-phosphate phosphatase family protein